MNNKLKHLSICVLILGFLLPGHVAEAQKKRNGRPEPKEIKVPKDITYDVLQYREGEHPRAGQMGIAFKADGNTDKPVVVFIHGGGWRNGDKDAVAYQLFNVARQGFVGVSLSYRLLSEAPFPACIEDVKQAIRFLKSKENEFAIDTKRIGVWGYSAGAHLALMIALSPEETFKTESFSEFDSDIKTVMAVSAPTDFVSEPKGALTKLGEGQVDVTSFMKRVSPITYVNKDQVPVYLLHGTDDPIVKPYHYKNFVEKSQKEGVENLKLYEFPKAGHMFYFKNREEVNPIFQEFLKTI